MSQDPPRLSQVEAPLPVPNSRRWQPLRLGLVDMFYYDDEQFWFHDGRLLLRGNNGTGKSKVLALTLPFLLDGSLHPWRVEPDADAKKRMDWNLLLGGAHPNPERTGYSWIEFGRVDADGAEHFITLGIGLKAAAGRGIVKSWYFTTERRVGELRLVDEYGTVLSQERLRDELEHGTGQLYLRQEAYRRAVDEALFQLGEERYTALIDLLIQLRQPQLSKKPDERALSAALTEALAPIDQAVVADVAESFRSLEEERDGIAEARETLDAAEGFLRHYRSYARIASRRHTSALRLKYSEYEHAGRNLREAEERQEAARAVESRLASQLEDATQRQSVLRGQEEALRERPEMRDAERLVRAEEAAREAEERTENAEAELRRADEIAAETMSAAEASEIAAAEARLEAEQAGERARPAAIAAGMADRHEQSSADQSVAERELARRREQIAHIEALLETAEEAARHAQQARQQFDVAEADASARGEGKQRAERAVEEAVREYRAAVRECFAALTAVSIAENSDEVADLAEDWARSMVGDSPARQLLDAGITSAQARIAAERAAAVHEEQDLAAELESLRVRIAELRAGRDPEPEPSSARDHAARADREGGPLWRLTDFADDVPEATRAGIEAALQSAGLLDAWILPGGEVVIQGDVVLGASGAEVGESLAQLLIAPLGTDAPVAADTVRGVLARIGLGKRSGADLWVSSDGVWGAGPARGSWTKPHAEYIGAGAREHRRRTEIAALQEQQSEREHELEVARQRISDADAEAAAVDRDRHRYPAQSERALDTVHERAAAAQRELDRAALHCQEQRQSWEQRALESAEAAEHLEQTSERMGLGVSRGELDAVKTAVHGYELALKDVWNSATRLGERIAQAAEAAQRSASAAAVAKQRAAEHSALRSTSVKLRQRFTRLHETVGATVAELQAQLSETVAALTHIAGELHRLAEDRNEAAAERGSRETEVRNLRERRQTADLARIEAGDGLRSFLETGLLRVGAPELPVPELDDPSAWSVTAALALARAAEQELQNADESDEAWRRVQQRVSNAHTELSTQMGRFGHVAALEQSDEVMIARVRYLREELDIDLLADRLRDDVASRERLLSAREREILENHLVNDAAGHLHELMLSAEDQIDQMNRELAARKTSTGMQLRVRWRERADGPADLAAARAILIRSDATWSADERKAIGDFLHLRIAEIRLENPSGGWQEHLEQALDYRQWHDFVIERHQNGQWRSASGPASGGERVLAMSVPLFAAASAHYNSAGAHAPRLILLDEAFAGVDDDSRAKSLGLLATFDLDVVMTSEREWGCYPQVPGLSIVQLSRVEGIDAVGVVRWQWDGKRRARGPEVVSSARASGEVSDEETAEVLDGLF